MEVKGKGVNPAKTRVNPQERAAITRLLRRASDSWELFFPFFRAIYIRVRINFLLSIVDRNLMEYQLRHQVWEKYGGKCQICNIELYEVEERSILEELVKLNEIPVYKWDKVCWKCGKTTPIVSYSFVLDYNYSIGDVAKLDAKLLVEYPFVKRKYSKTRGQEVIANTCIHCESLQGNFFTQQDLLKFDTDESLENKIDTIIRCDLAQSDFDLDEEALQPNMMKSSSGHVHHIDKNPSNNILSNLVLLCSSCHRKVHSGTIQIP